MNRARDLRDRFSPKYNLVCLIWALFSICLTMWTALLFDCMYKFKFETLLNHRKFTEEILQREFSNFKRMLDDENVKLQNLKKEMKQISNKLRCLDQDANLISVTKLYSIFIDRLSSDIAKQEKKLKKTKKKFLKSRDDLIAAMKKRKIIEKLKEDELKTYVQDLHNKEMSFCNEVALSRFKPKA